MSVRGRAWLSCWLAGMMASGALGAPADYIGAIACGKCHPAQFAGQSKGGHSLALRRAPDHPLAKAYMASPDWKRGTTYQFVFSRRSDGFFVQAFDYAARQNMELPIEWAFGAGNHAVTFVSRVTGEVYLEHAFSYYPDTKSMDLTPGHRLMQADSLPKAMGVLHRASAPRDPAGGIRNCFGCHSTGPVRDSSSGLVPKEMGIRCEVCHGPGSAHQQAVLDGKGTDAKAAISNPSRMRADEINEFCGTCHRFPGQKFAVNWNAQWNVRHQPPYLRQSRCFLESGGRLTCFTCHNPHAPLQKADPRYYARKCVDCHSKEGHRPAAVCRAQASGDCVSCHMPGVTVTSHLTFVNHWIGIYRDGEKLKPAVRAKPAVGRPLKIGLDLFPILGSLPASRTLLIHGDDRR